MIQFHSCICSWRWCVRLLALLLPGQNIVVFQCSDFLPFVVDSPWVGEERRTTLVLFKCSACEPNPPVLLMSCVCVSGWQGTMAAVLCVWQGTPIASGLVALLWLSQHKLEAKHVWKSSAQCVTWKWADSVTLEWPKVSLFPRGHACCIFRKKCHREKRLWNPNLRKAWNKENAGGNTA